MDPVSFPQANTMVRPPRDLSESQCMTIPAYVGQVSGGSVDGSVVIVTAWKPWPEELAALNEGKPIYLSFIGGLPPHFPTVDFESAIHPA